MVISLKEHFIYLQNENVLIMNMKQYTAIDKKALKE